MVLRANGFPLKKFRLVPCLFHLWREVTWIQMCPSLNHRKKMKAEPSRLIPRKPTENLELLFVSLHWVIRVVKQYSQPKLLKLSN